MSRKAVFLGIMVYMMFSCVGSFAEHGFLDLRHEIRPQLGFCAHLLADAPVLTDISYAADVCIDVTELQALTGLVPGALVTYDRLSEALSLFVLKHKFMSLDCTLEKDAAGVRLALYAHAAWTVKKVQCSGSFVHKERYRRHYFLESGDFFDAEHHQAAVAQVRQALCDDGYCAAVVTDMIQRHEATKEVTITLMLVPGKVCTIRDISLETDALPLYHDEVRTCAQDSAARMLIGAECCRATLAAYEAAVRLALRERGFGDVHITCTPYPGPKKAQMAVAVNILFPEKKKLVFVGNAALSEEDLMNVCSPVGPDAPQMPPLVLAHEIREKYRSRGFFDVLVTWQEEEACYRYTITEGARYRVTDVCLTGVAAFEKDQLIKRYLAAITSAPFYDEEVLVSCCDALIEAYCAQGFWDMRIERRECVPHGEGEVSMCITLIEGIQKKLIGMSFARPEVCLHECLRPYHALHEPIPFDRAVLLEYQHKLTQYLHEKGYIYSAAKPELKEEEAGIRVIWHVVGGVEPVAFGKTVILGSSCMPAYVLLRELAYAPGDVWSRDALERSITRLKSLDVFESISLKPAALLTSEPSKTMVLRVVENDPFEIRTRLGVTVVDKNLVFHGGATYRAGASLVWRNPSKRGDKLQLTIEMSRFTREIAALYRWPRLWGLPVALTSKIYTSYYDQPFSLGFSEILYNVIRTGIAAQCTARHAAIEWGVNVGFEFLKIRKISRERAEILCFAPSLVDRAVPYVLIEPNIFLDYLDNKVQPTQGFYTVLSARGMFPIALRDAWYIKILFEQSCFVPVFTETVFAFRLRCGHIFHSDFTRIMPTERFYLGGSHSLRGYQPDHAPPLNPYIDAQGNKHVVPIGAKTMMNVNLEVRFPIYQALGGVGFTDFGLLSQHHCATIVRTTPLLGSSGFGLRYNSSFGPIRFDIGWKWKKRFPEDSAFSWFLTLGHSF